jgi:hypothetical protein
MPAPSAYIVPLQPNPQTFQITLGSNTYRFTALWRNNALGGWFLDIADANNNALVSGIPMVTGCDLLAQYKYLNFGGQLVVQTTSDTDAVPTFINLGSDGMLYWIPNP